MPREGDFKVKFWVGRKSSCRRICATWDWSKKIPCPFPLSVDKAVSRIRPPIYKSDWQPWLPRGRWEGIIGIFMIFDSTIPPMLGITLLDPVYKPQGTSMSTHLDKLAGTVTQLLPLSHYLALCFVTNSCPTLARGEGEGKMWEVNLSRRCGSF